MYSFLLFSGMWAFAVTVFLWSFYNVGARSVNSDVAIVGMGLFVGGLAMFMAGMWEFPRGNVFGSACKYFDPTF